MPRCPDCNSSGDIFGLYGDGVCSHCHGDTKSLMSGLNEAIMGTVLKCNYCDGSGVCQTCGGSGTVGGNDDKEEYFSVHRTEPEQPSSQSSSFFLNRPILITTRVTTIPILIHRIIVDHTPNWCKLKILVVTNEQGQVVTVEKGERYFLTTACLQAAGLPDNCKELQTLRRFRDEYVSRLPNGSAILSHYLNVA